MFIIRYQHLYVKFTGDSSMGLQKFLKLATPRIRGLPIFVAKVYFDNSIESKSINGP